MKKVIKANNYLDNLYDVEMDLREYLTEDMFLDEILRWMSSDERADCFETIINNHGIDEDYSESISRFMLGRY